MDAEGVGDQNSLEDEVEGSTINRSTMFVLFITNDKGVLLMSCIHLS